MDTLDIPGRQGRRVLDWYAQWQRVIWWIEMMASEWAGFGVSVGGNRNRIEVCRSATPP